jgi:hypothetical protein
VLHGNPARHPDELFLQLEDSTHDTHWLSLEHRAPSSSSKGLQEKDESAEQMQEDLAVSFKTYHKERTPSEEEHAGQNPLSDIDQQVARE